MLQLPVSEKTLYDNLDLLKKSTSNIEDFKCLNCKQESLGT